MDQQPEYLKRYVDAKWSNRSDALVFLEAILQILRNRQIGDSIHHTILEAYSGIANTNAVPRYILDGVLLKLIGLSSR